MAEGNGRNGNGSIITTLLMTAGFVVGIVIGVYANQASAADKFVTKAQYDKDQFRIESSLLRIEEKLDALKGSGR